MTLAVALIVSELIVFLAAVLWYVLSLLTGALSEVSSLPFIVMLICGFFAAAALSVFQRRRYVLPSWSFFPAALVLIIPVFISVRVFLPTAQFMSTLNLYAAMLFALFAIRNVLKKLSLDRREEISVLISRFLRIFGLIIFITVITLPFYFMIFLSITPRALFLQNPVNLAPRFSIGLKNFFVGYTEVMTTFNFGRYIINSLLVSIASVIITMIPATFGAYAVTRLRFPGQKLLSRSILLIYMFPSIVLAIPLYSVFASLGLRDSLIGLLIVYPAITTPVSLYMLRNYFQTLPRDIEEAGIIDGCSRFSVIRRITLPLSFPALLAVGLYIFMIAWNEFLFAFMFLDKQTIFTLSRGIVSLNSQEVPRQFLMAGAIIITAPVMLIFFSLERFFAGGLVAGSVKG
ncbi:MAG: carbohydrate ABC transporter permease [Salinispira sp.]